MNEWTVPPEGIFNAAASFSLSLIQFLQKYKLEVFKIF